MAAPFAVAASPAVKPASKSDYEPFELITLINDVYKNDQYSYHNISLSYHI